ncbi:MAG: bifunctional diaminohydroxyphosphoribosylaminopyrimidine deaminase/5-amino-6-(5-phosphoribosylamino)uracil reductase RibD [Acidobacteriota bacterium]|nr:bifunctional diaminohydroxyphosphoribosylaminopyrimidine deaminase/5-amino-6-(5-phosphoribosylamino)uracil reductase RibD [Acidobacteriota bacterium]
MNDTACLSFMRQALALAIRVQRSTTPNPRVGCVVVAGEEVVGVGYHCGPGTDHAEAVALKAAGAAARGAALYVNLEPCHHTGKTPPCTESIIRHGVGRVVAAMQDPDPRVDGAGFSALREAGVQVDVGLLESDARWLNAGFVNWHETGRPWVTLKAAVSADGLLAAAGGDSHWISNPESRRFTHRQRAEHDAILVGAGTVRRDDPRLTVRLGARDASPLPVILSSRLELNRDARLFCEGRRPLVYTLESADQQKVEGLSSSADIVRLPSKTGNDEQVEIDALLDDLGRRGIQHLLVEGGAAVTGAFVTARRVDRVIAFMNPRFLGARGAVPWVDADAVASPAEGLAIRRTATMALGEDLVIMGDAISVDAGD